MGLEKIVATPGRVWALWKVNETETELVRLLGGKEAVPDTLTHPQKRLEFLGGRVIIQHLLQHLGYDYQGIDKDEHGKPSPRGHALHLSLSHSFPYVAAIVDALGTVGIDLEQPKDKLLRVAGRVLHADELRDAGSDVVKHCIYWCAKEAMLKIYGKKDLIFAENLLVRPFTREAEGHITGRIIANDDERVVPLYYLTAPGFVVVFNQT